MFSSHRSTNKVFALFTFSASLILYLLTISPTASFWDPGEFIAVAHGLQVNHPPGAPFHSLLGRVFSMFMPADSVALSINFMSALASALSVMFLYLIIVLLVQEWKGDPDEMSLMDKIGMYGGALIGSLTFAATDTFWFSAVEAEVYALSMFFTSIVVWMALKWAENHDEPYSERWLILIAYMFGLAIGVHLLNLLALFFVALIIYFKKQEFAFKSFALMGGIAVVAFFLIYPFTIQIIPQMMESVDAQTYGLIGPFTFLVLVAAALAGGIYYTQTRNHRLANIILIAYAMILIGYTSYSVIFIRSMADPPIDENDPETIERFISYLEREQYGQTPLLSGYNYDNDLQNINREEEVLFPRRYSTQGNHMQEYAKYSSDWQYFIDYQLNHMYLRYFAWNFIGRDSDIQDTGWQSGFTDTRHEDNPAHNSYFYLPFLLGLLGMVFHFQKDWRRAISVLALFLLTGVAIIIYLNQTPMQPRERDYAYVGSFFSFAIWVGLGGTAFIELIKDNLRDNTTAAYATIGVLLAAVPAWMLYQNYDDHDRSNRYVAPDYAHNLLNSAAPNAILFTNGDNDTFPLWYLQEVEGVRTDVRVVNLSLLNTDWYIKQMRDQWSHESPPLPISLTDEEIEEMTQSYSLHQPDTISIPVDKELLADAYSSEESYKEALGVDPDTSVEIFSEEIEFQMPLDSLDNQMSWYFEGRPAGQDEAGNQRYYTSVQDEVILNMLENNNWLRPIYFANTVSPQGKMNLQNYFQFEGKAFRVVPRKAEEASTYGWLDPELHGKRLRSFQFREWDNPDVYFDENIRGMLGNYRFSITEQAETWRQMGQPDSARHWLQWGEDKIPFNAIEGSVNSLVLYAYSYAKAGDTENSMRLAQQGKDILISDLEYQMSRYDAMEDEIMELEEQSQSARSSADTETQRELQQQMQEASNRRQEITQEISYTISHLTLTQRVMYMADEEEMTEELADEVNALTMQRIELPSTCEENKEQVDRFGLD